MFPSVRRPDSPLIERAINFIVKEAAEPAGIKPAVSTSCAARDGLELTGLLGRARGSCPYRASGGDLHGERRVVLGHAACHQVVVEEHSDGGQLLFQAGGRRAIGLWRLRGSARIRTDVLYVLAAAAVLEEGEGQAERPTVGSPRRARVWVLALSMAARGMCQGILGLPVRRLSTARAS